MNHYRPLYAVTNTTTVTIMPRTCCCNYEKYNSHCSRYINWTRHWPAKRFQFIKLISIKRKSISKHSNEQFNFRTTYSMRRYITQTSGIDLLYQHLTRYGEQAQGNLNVIRKCIGLVNLSTLVNECSYIPLTSRFKLAKFWHTLVHVAFRSVCYDPNFVWFGIGSFPWCNKTHKKEKYWFDTILASFITVICTHSELLEVRELTTTRCCRTIMAIQHAKLQMHANVYI